MSNWETRKADFIQELVAMRDEVILAALIEAYRQIKNTQKKPSMRAVKGIRPHFDAAAIRHRRDRKGHDKTKIMRIIREMEVKEPIELLLSQLSK